MRFRPSLFTRNPEGEAELSVAEAQVNRLISHGGFDLILSIGQVVPHEVIGTWPTTTRIF